jgi:hypothetical protein
MTGMIGLYLEYIDAELNKLDSVMEALSSLFKRLK